MHYSIINFFALKFFKVMKPIQPRCPPVDCWKSQLTVLSKANLTWNYNTFRNELARRNGINGMVKVVRMYIFVKLEKQILSIFVM